MRNKGPPQSSGAAGIVAVWGTAPGQGAPLQKPRNPLQRGQSSEGLGDFTAVLVAGDLVLSVLRPTGHAWEREAFEFLYSVHTVTLRAYATYYLWGEKKVFTQLKNP